MAKKHAKLAKKHAEHAGLDKKHAVFLGQCIEVVYKMYFPDTNNPTPTPSWALPAGYKFVAWVQMAAVPHDYKFYGLIARSPSDPNKCVLAFRGTDPNDINQVFVDLHSIVLAPMPGFGQVGAGFYELYKTFRVVYPLHESALGGLGVESLESEGSFADQVVAAVRHHSAKAYKSAQFEVTGHSLGAALATIHVAHNSLHHKATIPLICTFGSPLVGDQAFASNFDKLLKKPGFKSWRIVNTLDWAPTLPPTLPFPFPGFRHVQTEYRYTSSTVFSLMCVHSLETYLHLLDPTQPLQYKCIPPSLTATAPSRAQERLTPAAAALSASTEKEIVLSMGSTTINITIKSGRS
jgi:hypothetical protein